MSKMVEINFRPDDRTLRQFGWIALGGFGFVAAIAWFELLIFSFGLGAARPWVAGICGGLAGVAAPFSLVYPRAHLPISVALAVLPSPPRLYAAPLCVVAMPVSPPERAPGVLVGSTLVIASPLLQNVRLPCAAAGSAIHRRAAVILG